MDGSGAFRLRATSKPTFNNSLIFSLLSGNLARSRQVTLMMAEWFPVNIMLSGIGSAENAVKYSIQPKVAEALLY
jgi:hypothetical protein